MSPENPRTTGYPKQEVSLPETVVSSALRVSQTLGCHAVAWRVGLPGAEDLAWKCPCPKV